MARENILIVDDEPHIGGAFKRTLEKRGHKVDCVLNGLLALEAVKAKHYALAFIDQNMPGMNGLETCRAIKKIDPDLRAIFITGLFCQENRLYDQQFIEAGGISHYIYKPFAQGEIVDVVNKALCESDKT